MVERRIATSAGTIAVDVAKIVAEFAVFGPKFAVIALTPRGWMVVVAVVVVITMRPEEALTRWMVETTAVVATIAKLWACHN